MNRMQTTQQRWWPGPAVGFALWVWMTGWPHAAIAQDAVTGKALYKTWCQVCHSVDPSTAIEPFNRIMSAANNPAQITAAAVADPSQMGFIATALTGIDLQNIAAYLGTFATAPAAVDVVEFHHAARDHYFMSGAAAEIADLDQGVHPGWLRTGAVFKAFASTGNGTSPVCRFYLPPTFGDSHFYSASATECTQVQAAFPFFTYEAPAVFHIALPHLVTGACPSSTLAVYRVWNARADTNHRYTTSSAVQAQMVGAGWIAEGYGPTQVIMCAAS